MATNEKYNLHVISTTHWDREWYLTFQEFRIHLVELMDELLRLLDDDPAFWRFMLDGQTVPLEDYLEIRPERAAQVKKYVRGGQIELGPWYVLADEWLASPESHVRNMQIGLSDARRFGREMRVAYLPDEFGHISQMPQILQGFGYDSVFFSRGAHGHLENSQIWWTGADGSTILAHTQSYGNAGRAFRSAENPLGLIDEQVAEHAPRTRTPHLLMMNGGDHRHPLANLRQLVKEYNETRPHSMEHTTLEAFFNRIKASDLSGIPEISGELLDDMKDVGRGVSLHNCASSRIFNKQMNQLCNDALERWAEPFTAVASALGTEHPSALLWQSWKYLVQNYAHDSICGCSVDRVHDQMMTRFEWSQEIANRLTQRAQGAISAKAQVGKIPAGCPTFAVWNPSTYSRSGLVEAIVETPEGWDRSRPVCVIDPSGRKIAAQRVPAKADEELGTTCFTLHSEVKERPDAISFWADDLPAMGYRVYGAAAEECPADSPLKYGDNWAENKFVKMEIADNGSVTIKDKASGAVFSGCGVFEDGGDVGGGYHFQAPAKDKVITSENGKAVVEIADGGPAMARFRVELTMKTPDRPNADRSARGSKLVPMRIVSYVTLGAGAKSVNFRTMVWNQAVDHRLRVIFPTGLKTDSVHVDGHFDVMERPIAVDKKEWLTERQRRWVDVSNGKKGLAVMNYGLPEYEVTDDSSRTIKLTLFRSNSYVTKEWWNTLRSPQAELLGKSEYEYAVYAHAGDWRTGRVNTEIESALLPLRTQMVHVEAPAESGGDAPAETSFVTIESTEAVTSIVKKADNRGSLVVRLYNPTDEDTVVTARLWKQILEAYELNLEEERMIELTPSGKEVTLPIPRKKIVTLEFVTQ